MERKTREEKAITLIALIITIVVLLILAVVAINAVTGDGIIQHATNAKTEYEKAQDEEQGTLSYYQQYLDTKGDVGPWKQEENKIYMTNSAGKTINLEIGDIVNYDPTKDEEGNDIITEKLTYSSEETKNGVSTQTFTATKGAWKVLGIENGKILLISADDIKTNNSENYKIASNKLYLSGIEELNNICSKYGYGKGAQSARSVVVEDIDKITGYNVKVLGNKKEGLHAYGVIIKYTSQEGKITYEPKIDENDDGIVKDNNGTIITDYTIYYIENGEWQETLNIGESKSFKINEYSYAAYKDNPYVNESKYIKMNMNTSSKEYEMLFKNSKNSTESAYFLASVTTSINENYMYSIFYGIRWVAFGLVGWNSGSAYTADEISRAIRPVVVLEKDVELEIAADGISYDIVL